MKNKNTILVLFMMLSAVSAYAQDTATTDNAGVVETSTQNPDAQAGAGNNPIEPQAPPDDTANLPVIPTETNKVNTGIPLVADEKITTVLVDNFELPQGWTSDIPLDFGISRLLYRDGAPREVADSSNKMVMGVKTVFFKRNFGWMDINRPYPITLNSIVPRQKRQLNRKLLPLPHRGGRKKKTL